MTRSSAASRLKSVWNSVGSGSGLNWRGVEKYVHLEVLNQSVRQTVEDDVLLKQRVGELVEVMSGLAFAVQDRAALGL